MQLSEAYHWLLQGQRRKTILIGLKQPMTARQLGRLAEMSTDSCAYALWELSVYRLVRCVNPMACSSRLYWLTPLGVACQRKLHRSHGLEPREHEFPIVDWALYGWVCFRHRAAVIGALVEPLQPAAIRRKATAQNPQLRMSANNTRDVIRLFLARGIVRAVPGRPGRHPRYELTDVGRKLQLLLRQAEALS